MTEKKSLQVCEKGHSFNKKSCPVCPVCESEKELPGGFLAMLGKPARNTLLYHGIDTLKKLSKYTEKEVLSLHGMGKSSLPALHKALASAGLSFRKEEALKVTGNSNLKKQILPKAVKKQ